MKPDRVILYGTSGSMWDVLIENLASDTNDNEEQRLALMEAVKADVVDQRALDELKSLAANSVGLPIQLRLIPYGIDAREQRQIIQAISEETLEGDDVILDVTHGLRSLPAIGLMGALYLRDIRRTRIEAIYYAALERSIGAETPVWQLDSLIEMANWIQAMAAFNRDGDYIVFVPLLEQAGAPIAVVTDLREAAFLERIHHVGNARGKLKKFRREFRQWVNGQTGPVALFADALMERTSWCEQEHMYARQQALARQSLNRGDFLRASIFAFEAFITRLVSQTSDNPDSFDDRACEKERYESSGTGGNEFESYRRLRDIRNALAHGSRSDRAEIQRVLSEESRLRSELETIFCQLNI